MKTQIKAVWRYSEMVDCDSQDTETEEEETKINTHQQVNQRIREYVSTVNLTVHMK